VANVGNSNDEDYGGQDGHGDDSPDCIDETAAGIANSKHRYANACFDRDRASAVEELGDEKELAIHC
jgi:hypothetical protein